MNILIPIDFSRATDAVLAEGVKLAKCSPSELILLNVVDPDPDFVGYEPGPQTERDFVSTNIHNNRERLHMEADKLKELELNAKAVIRQGGCAEMILKESVKHNADYIIMGTHGHGSIYHLVVGSVTESVIRHAKCPVIVIPIKE